MSNEIFWIDAPWLGKLAIVTRPRGDDWLKDEMQRLRKAGFDVILSLLEQSENRELGLFGEAAAAETIGLEFVSFPIPDRSLPASRWQAIELIQKLNDALLRGKNVAIHCRQGIGRSSMLAASLLVKQNASAQRIDASTAFDRIQSARGAVVPDTAEQREWVEQLARLERVPSL